MKFLQRFSKSQNVFSPAVRWVLERPFLKIISLKFPRLFQFLRNRFSTKKFNGLPLTFLTASFIANMLLLFEIVEAFENSPVMLSIDNSISLFLFTIRSRSMANAFFYFTQLGSLPVVIMVASIAIILFLRKKMYIHIIALLTALTGTGITVFTGKLFFHRLRPLEFAFYNVTSYSFPSGHATLAIAFYGMLFYMAIRSAAGYKNKFQLLAAGVLFISLLGFSRLYLGVHFISDVVAGFSLGTLWLLSAVSILEWKFYSNI